MNDPLKDFVKRHREEFDHLDAPVLKLDQLKAKFQRVPELQKNKFSLLIGNRWLVAASILITLTCAWFFFYSNHEEQPVVQIAQQKTNNKADKIVNSGIKENTPIPAGDAEQSAGLSEIKPKSPSHEHQTERVATPEQKVHDTKLPASDLYAKLKDSTSASSRLLAILEIEKADRIDNHVLDLLATTLDQDGNTNVRLAALNLLEKFSADGHVSSILIGSLENQTDPIVQLGLVSLLGKMKNIEINAKLESLAYSPNTFAAVRDEAYSILLNQNKL
jgi:hypothetical protein